MMSGFNCLRALGLSLVVLFLIAVSGPLHVLAQTGNDGNINDQKYLKYTPKDFVESLGMKPQGQAGEGQRDTRQFDIFLKTIQAQKYFVGNEPLQVTFEIYIPFAVRISELKLDGELKPFELISLNTGARTSALNMKKYEKQKVVLTVRLPEGNPYGPYELPSLEISCEYEKASGDEPETLRKAVPTGAVEFQKVPLFVQLIQEHDTCIIGDAVSFSIEIHADSSSEVLNEYPPEGSGENSAYLSEYRPGYPFVLIDKSRHEALAENYRIIRWVYTVSPHDFMEEELSLTTPQVMWRQRSMPSASSESDVSPEKSIRAHTVTPDALSFKVIGMTEGYDAFKPMKMIRRDPGHERLWFSTIPGIAVWALLVSSAAMVLAYSYRTIRARRELPPKSVDTGAPQRARLDYDSWVYIRFLLKHRLQKVWHEFQGRPDRENCTVLRSLMARRSAFRYKKKRLSVQEACAMTASELTALVGAVPEAGIIRELDRQLEMDQFVPLSGSGELDDVI